MRGKCTEMTCGCGPSDCQKEDVEAWRSAWMPQPGLDEDTVHDARAEMSLSPVGSGAEAAAPARPV